MSHTFAAKNTTFVYNPDLSGEVTIAAENTKPRKVVTISGNDLRTFMAWIVRQERIARLEDATDEEVLGFCP